MDANSIQHDEQPELQPGQRPAHPERAEGAQRRAGGQARHASPSDWQKLDEYVAQKAYIAAYGQEKQPMFFSNRIDFGAAVFSPLYGNDWSSIALK